MVLLEMSRRILNQVSDVPLFTAEHGSITNSPQSDMVAEGLQPLVQGEVKMESGRDITQKNIGTDKAFRITKIPANFTVNDVQKALCPQSPATALVGSLAPDADSIDSASYQVATAMFKPLIPPFLDLRPDHPVRCTYEDNTEGQSRSVIVDCLFLGLTTLASPSLKSKITMDLIAVTGLNGHPFASWKERGGNFTWLRDGLPQALPNVRIITYGYDSRLHGSTSFASIGSYGKSFLADVVSARTAPEELNRPLVFIGHSLGGLLIKEALVQASRSDSTDKNVFDSTHGLIFLGVPHRGLRVEHLLAMVEGQPNEEFLESLKPESPYLDALHENFGDAIKRKDLTIYSYYETAESRTAKRVGGTWKLEGPLSRLVTKSSATGARPGELPSYEYPMNRSHSEMAKFEDGNTYYRQIRNWLSYLELNASALYGATTTENPGVSQSYIEYRSESQIEVRTKQRPTMSGLEIADLTLTTFDHACKLGDFLRQVIAAERHYSSKVTAVRVRMDDQQLRLRILQQLLFDEPPPEMHPVKRLFDEFELEWKFTVLEMLKQLGRLLASYIPLQILHRLNRPAKDIQPFQVAGADTDLEFFEGTQLEEEIQSRDPIWVKWRYELWEKGKAVGIVEEFTNWNNRVHQNLELIFLRVRVFRSSQGLELLQSDPKAKSLGLSRSARLRNILLNKRGVEDKCVEQSQIVMTKEKLSHLSIGVWKEGQKRVVLEYKKFRPENDGRAPDFDVEDMNELASLLDGDTHAEFSMFRCGGFFEDRKERQFGIFFEIPRGLDPSSAFSLLQAYTLKRPTLGERHFRASTSLGGSTRASEATSCSSSIRTPDAGRGGQMPKPLNQVLFGLEYVRRGPTITSGEFDDIFERNVYRHPERQGRPRGTFKRKYDIYALGVIFLEIGAWKPVRSLLGNLSNGGDREEIREKVISNAESRLSMQMGDRFREVTLKCLRGDFGVKSDDEDESGLQKAFHENVIDVLRNAAVSV